MNKFLPPITLSEWLQLSSRLVRVIVRVWDLVRDLPTRVRGLPTRRRPLLVLATDQVPASNDTSYLPPRRNTAHLPVLPNMSRPPLAHTTADSFPL
jgi:hypothetical protein